MVTVLRIFSSDNKGLLSSFFICLLPFPFPLFCTPFGSSIIRKINTWSEDSIGATEMSLTALNLPQLFKCSFSKRKKFQMNLLKTSRGAVIDVIKSELIILASVRKNAGIHKNRRRKSSTMAK